MCGRVQNGAFLRFAEGAESAAALTAWVAQHQFDVFFDLTFAAAAAWRESRPATKGVAVLYNPAANNFAALQAVRQVGARPGGAGS